MDKFENLRLAIELALEALTDEQSNGAPDNAMDKAIDILETALNI